MKNKTCGECRFYHPILKQDGVCTFTTELRKVCDFSRRCAVGDVCPKPPPTNGDVIRQGGNQALAEFKKKHKCDCCIYSRNGNCTEPVDRKDRCEDGLKQWLNTPAESEGEDDSQSNKSPGIIYRRIKNNIKFFYSLDLLY